MVPLNNSEGTVHEPEHMKIIRTQETRAMPGEENLRATLHVYETN